MMQAEKVTEELSEASEALGGGGSSAPLVAAALRRIERRVEQLPELLGPVMSALERALDSLEEARSTVERALGEAAFDPRDLEVAEERLFALRAAARKHQVAVDDLPALRDRFATDLAAITDGGDRVKSLETAAEAARQAYNGAAAKLGRRGAGRPGRSTPRSRQSCRR